MYWKFHFIFNIDESIKDIKTEANKEDEIDIINIGIFIFKIS